MNVNRTPLSAPESTARRHDARRLRWLGLAMVMVGLGALLLRNFVGIDPRLVELASIPCIGFGLLLFAVALAGGRHVRRRQTGNR